MDYMPIVVTTLAACVVAVVTTTIGAWVTVPFALRRFRMERRWERREEAYERILHGLAHLKDYLDVKFNEEIERRKIPKEVEDDLRTKAQKARKEIKLAIDLGGFLIAVDARERLARFEAEGQAASREPSWFEYLDASLAATISCLDDLTEIAARDLK